MNSLQYVKYFVHRSEYSTLKRSARDRAQCNLHSRHNSPFPQLVPGVYTAGATIGGSYDGTK